jgi:hypothetical protein
LIEKYKETRNKFLEPHAIDTIDKGSETLKI